MKNLIYEENYLNKEQKKAFLDYLESLDPLWENRFSKHNPPPEGDQQRRLLRPVYWLGNWQFACLNYYHPPKGIDFRCVQAEPFPEFMQQIVYQIEEKVRNEFSPIDVPHKWHFNTCLINYYGSAFMNGKKLDAARVGEHKDFEPGPVASISFGEKALFQFVESYGRDRKAKSKIVLQQWLADSSLQVFGGDKFKKKLFHRVQRVEEKLNKPFNVKISDFETRRINLTFRYVPDDHIQPFCKFPSHLQEDITEYMQALAKKSAFFETQLKRHQDH